MRTEYTRQTRWDGDPERIDPDQFPSGSPYVREWIWVPCTTCDLQVHAALARSLREGVACPECGQRLIVPVGAGGEAADKIVEEERRLSRELDR
jgi:hypothetical protein